MTKNKDVKPLPPAVVTNDKVILNGAHRVPFPAVSDWIIVQPELDKPKKVLAQVTKVGKDAVGVIFEKGREKEETEQTLKLDLNQVFLNLGPAANTDFVGMSVMGVKLEFFKGKKETALGEAYFFHEIEKENWKMFKKGVERVREILGSMYMLDKLSPVEFVFQKPGGQYDGFYKVVSEGPDQILVRLKEWTPKNVMWLLLHEFAHGILAYMLPKQDWAAWIRLYHRYVKVMQDKELVSLVRDDYIRLGKNYEPASEDQEMIFDECISYIEEKHMLEKKHLDILIDEGDSNTLVSIWPKTADLSEQEEAITEYAKKSPEEFFCEAFAFFNISERSRSILPKIVQDRMENDIAAIIKRNKAKGKK